MNKDIKHALDKVRENADELDELDPYSDEARHCIFQMSYNIGRLAELTGLGRQLYDVVKCHITAGDWSYVVEAVESLVEEPS